MKILLSVLLGIALLGCALFALGLTATQGNLDEAAALLETARSELADAESNLKNAESELQAANDKLTNTLFELEETRSELTGSAARLDTALEYNIKMDEAYAALRQQISRKLGHGEDSRLIITPHAPAVSAKVREIAGSFSPDWNEVWQDYQRMYEWVEKNIEYSYDSALPVLPETPDGRLLWISEYWKLPEETLEDRAGDCEDLTGLLASMMLNYNNLDYRVWAIVIRGNDGSGHVAVALPVVGNQLAIFDVAGRYYTGMKSGRIAQLDIHDAVGDWLKTWSLEMPGAAITAAFSHDFNREFDGTQAFIDWAISLD